MRRRIDPQAIYYSYFNAPETMFPVPDRDGRLETKDVVLGVQLNDAYKAYSSEALRRSRIVNDVLGGEQIVVLGSGESQGARVYYRGGRSFSLAPDDGNDQPGIPSVIVDSDRRDMAGDRGVSGQHERTSRKSSLVYPPTCRSGSDGSNSTRTRSCTTEP